MKYFDTLSYIHKSEEPLSEAEKFGLLHRIKLSVAKKDKVRPDSVRKKISRSMKGTSNFAGKEHSSKGKENISIGRGDYDPIKGKKWYVRKADSKTYRKTRNPTEVLYQHGRKVRKGKGLPESTSRLPEEFISFKDFVSEANYPGNLAAMELVKFHRIAKPQHKAELKRHIANGDKDKAFDLITKVTGMKLTK